jgi:hypothetical protein
MNAEILQNGLDHSNPKNQRYSHSHRLLCVCSGSFTNSSTDEAALEAPSLEPRSLLFCHEYGGGLSVARFISKTDVNIAQNRRLF